MTAHVKIIYVANNAMKTAIYRTDCIETALQLAKQGGIAMQSIIQIKTIYGL